VSPVGKVEASPKLDGRNMTMVLAPDRKAQQAHRSRPEPAVQAAPAVGETAPASEPAASEPAASEVPRANEPPSASGANGAAPAANGDNPKPAVVATPAGTSPPAEG